MKKKVLCVLLTLSVIGVVTWKTGLTSFACRVCEEAIASGNPITEVCLDELTGEETPTAAPDEELSTEGEGTATEEPSIEGTMTLEELALLNPDNIIIPEGVVDAVEYLKEYYSQKQDDTTSSESTDSSESTGTTDILDWLESLESNVQGDLVTTDEPMLDDDTTPETTQDPEVLEGEEGRPESGEETEHGRPESGEETTRPETGHGRPESGEETGTPETGHGRPESGEETTRPETGHGRPESEEETGTPETDKDKETGTQKPSTQKPEEQTPATPKPECPQPEVQAPVTPKPECPKPEVQTPATPKPECPQPEVQTPEINVETPSTESNTQDNSAVVVPQVGTDTSTEGGDSVTLTPVVGAQDSTIIETEDPIEKIDTITGESKTSSEKVSITSILTGGKKKSNSGTGVEEKEVTIEQEVPLTGSVANIQEVKELANVLDKNAKATNTSAKKKGSVVAVAVGVSAVIILLGVALAWYVIKKDSADFAFEE
ncbi:MAG: hypothetical protein E7262_00340 [Lachnospiraceae bacterium]|nr:hypothetical protein [Lachnospiraceae bacterium]